MSNGHKIQRRIELEVSAMLLFLRLDDETRRAELIAYYQRRKVCEVISDIYSPKTICGSFHYLTHISCTCLDTTSLLLANMIGRRTAMLFLAALLIAATPVIARVAEFGKSVSYYQCSLPSTAASW